MRNTWILWVALTAGLVGCSGEETGDDGTDGDVDTDTDTDTGTGTGTDTDTGTGSDTDTGTGTGTPTREQVFLIGIAADFDNPETFYAGETVTLQDTERSATTSSEGRVSFLVNEIDAYHLGMEMEGMVPYLGAALVKEDDYTTWLRPVTPTWRDGVLGQFATTNDDSKGHLIVFVVDLPDETPHAGAYIEYTGTYEIAIASDGASTYVEHDDATPLAAETRGFVLYANVDPGKDGELDIVPSPCDGLTTPRIEAGKITLVRFDCP